MSKNELSRLVGDAMSNSTMIAEAMTIQDQQGMEEYITSKGYALTEEEMLEVWSMTAKVMTGHDEPMSAAEARIRMVKNEVQE